MKVDRSMDIWFSIIIAAYNCRDYIRRCVESVIEQQLKNYELIIVDDGSNDGTSEICDEYDKYDGVTIIHQHNQGHTAARKNGIKKARGKYICILDADDWLESNYVSVLRDCISNIDYAPDVIAYNYNRVDPQNGNREIKSWIKSGYYNKDKLKQEVYPIMLSNPNGVYYTFGMFPTLWSKAFKKEIILEVMEMLDTDIVLGEDVFCVYLALIKAESLVVLEQSLYNYYINPYSLTRNYITNNFRKLTKLCELIDNRYPESLVDQIRRYKLYMLMGAITNETRGPLKTKDIIIELRNRCKLDTFDDCIQHTIIPNCPLFRKVIWKMLKFRMYRTLVSVLRILKA